MQFASRRLIRSGIAILVLASLVAFKIYFNPFAGEDNPFLLFLAGIMLSAWLGGIWLGLLTTAVAALLGHVLFVAPGQGLSLNWFEANFALGLFVLEGALISWGTSALRRALLALREADQRKDEFLAAVAHELRNHLSPLNYAVAFMDAAPKQADAGEWVRSVLESQLKQMLRLVDDLSDLSRIRAGKMRLHREPTLLANVVQDAVETSRPLIERMGHVLTVTLPQEPVYLVVDSARLVQTLVNLLNNAAKYTNPKGRIWLTAEAAEDDVQIRVRDTGVGIPAALLPTVFDRFTQLQGTLNRSQGGLG
ncbi:MAG TPA: HAMP domain-containing sensor histidine kinase, partial [Planctomycetaceae bacterium]|nr:HAMP domain-containing sensor histidine kinase [Planctomycetaceae bacterium]